MLWDVKYSSPPTKRAYLFLRSEALHPSATQLLHNLQLLGADVGIYPSLSEILKTFSAFTPSKQNLTPLTQHLQLYLSGQRLITIKKKRIKRLKYTELLIEQVCTSMTHRVTSLLDI